ncbi:hypothetical protein D1953_15550 [Peribacillus asahii]|uniref:Uncharacterized protein n=1 Tax=Peribacillus asahii TaxID=228899 RepID=A0A398B231_9BACI|nr:hypothetical protein [Peribacillus asahii]RID83711.1 hypothetical protein D1953_15550 [Peribacillus asahii]
MSSQVISGKYNFTYDDHAAVEDISYYLQNITKQCKTANETLLEAKEHLDKQSGDFIDSLSEWVNLYYSTSQLALDTQTIHFTSYMHKQTNLTEDTYQNRSYKIYYHTVESESMA